MPEYDAFGREIGENTLSGLGGADATIRPAPAPTPTPAPEDPRTEAPPPPETPMLTTPDAPPQRIRVRRARGLGCLVGLVVLAAVVAGPIIAVVSIVGSASDTIDGVIDAVDDMPTIDPPDVREPPVGIEGRSMIAPDNVADALQRLRGDGVKTVSRVTIWPDRLEAGTVKGRRERSVQLTFDGSVQRGDATAANRALGTVALADLDPKTPARLVRNAAKRYPVRERRINYLIAMSDVFSGDGGHRWIAYFKNGVYVEGDERGRVIRRIS